MSEDLVIRSKSTSIEKVPTHKTRWLPLTKELERIKSLIEEEINSLIEGRPVPVTYIVGFYGTGKTTLLYEIIRSGLNERIPSFYVDLVTLVDTLIEKIHEELGELDVKEEDVTRILRKLLEEKAKLLKGNILSNILSDEMWRIESREEFQRRYWLPKPDRSNISIKEYLKEFLGSLFDKYPDDRSFKRYVNTLLENMESNKFILAVDEMEEFMRKYEEYEEKEKSAIRRIIDALLGRKPLEGMENILIFLASSFISYSELLSKAGYIETVDMGAAQRRGPLEVSLKPLDYDEFEDFLGKKVFYRENSDIKSFKNFLYFATKGRIGWIPEIYEQLKGERSKKGVIDYIKELLDSDQDRILYVYNRLGDYVTNMCKRLSSVLNYTPIHECLQQVDKKLKPLILLLILKCSPIIMESHFKNSEKDLLTETISHLYTNLLKEIKENGRIGDSIARSLVKIGMKEDESKNHKSKAYIAVFPKNYIKEFIQNEDTFTDVLEKFLTNNGIKFEEEIFDFNTKLKILLRPFTIKLEGGKRFLPKLSPAQLGYLLEYVANSLLEEYFTSENVREGVSKIYRLSENLKEGNYRRELREILLRYHLSKESLQECLEEGEALVVFPTPKLIVELFPSPIFSPKISIELNVNIKEIFDNKDTLRKVISYLSNFFNNLKSLKEHPLYKKLGGVSLIIFPFKSDSMKESYCVLMNFLRDQIGKVTENDQSFARLVIIPINLSDNEEKANIRNNVSDILEECVKKLPPVLRDLYELLVTEKVPIIPLITLEEARLREYLTSLVKVLIMLYVSVGERISDEDKFKNFLREEKKNIVEYRKYIYFINAISEKLLSEIERSFRKDEDMEDVLKDSSEKASSCKRLLERSVGDVEEVLRETEEIGINKDEFKVLLLSSCLYEICSKNKFSNNLNDLDKFIGHLISLNEFEKNSLPEGIKEGLNIVDITGVLNKLKGDSEIKVRIEDYKNSIDSMKLITLGLLEDEEVLVSLCKNYEDIHRLMRYLYGHFGLKFRNADELCDFLKEVSNIITKNVIYKKDEILEVVSKTFSDDRYQQLFCKSQEIKDLQERLSNEKEIPAILGDILDTEDKFIKPKKLIRELKKYQEFMNILGEVFKNVQKYLSNYKNKSNLCYLLPLRIIYALKKHFDNVDHYLKSIEERVKSINEFCEIIKERRLVLKLAFKFFSIDTKSVSRNIQNITCDHLVQFNNALNSLVKYYYDFYSKNREVRKKLDNLCKLLEDLVEHLKEDAYV
mgnify:CR=1 FL=1